MRFYLGKTFRFAALIVYIASMGFLFYRLYSDIQSVPPMASIKAIDDWTPSVSSNFLFSLNGGKPIIDQWTYRGRVVDLIESSKVAVIGPILAFSRKGKAVPVEDVTGLDIGQTLIGNIQAKIANRAISIDDIFKQNLTINFLGMSFISLALFLLGWRLSAIGIVWVTLVDGLLGPFPSADTMGIFYGLSGLGISSVLFCWLACTWLRSSMRIALPLLLLSILCLAWILLIREPLGMLSLAAQLATIFLFFFGSNKLAQLNWHHLTLVLLLSLLPLKAKDVIFMTRNTIYNMSPESNFNTSHGFGHNLYIGLGSEPNPWGLRYDDNMGRKFLEDSKSLVSFGSSEYYTLIFNEYLRLVKSDPGLVFKMYVKKFKRTLSIKLDRARTGLLVTVVLFCLIACSITNLKSERMMRDENSSIVFPVLFFMIFLILLQGVLTTPDFVHIYPAYILSTFACFILLEFAMARWSTRKRTTPN